MFHKIIDEQMQFLQNKVAEMREDTIDEEEITEEDEEKINDAIDTTDLGAKADYEYQKEKDERI